MKIYIRSAANISPQKTFDGDMFLTQPTAYSSNRLTCIEPDYKEIIDPKLIRRMSRVIKMGVMAGLACLKAADVSDPDAIITGTAYGCLEDTGVFLTNMVEQDEEPLSPTAFVHSTHNTIGAQIALLLKCNQYNSTFVNGGASFEHALLDAIMMLTEGSAGNALIGGVDEVTDISHAILSRFGLYRHEQASNLDLFKSASKGTINGEGSAFFLLKNTPSTDDMAQIDAVHTFYKPDSISDIEQNITSFLTGQEIDPSDIDLLIMGNNGDKSNDGLYAVIQQSMFNSVPSVKYKHLCGEYPTSSAFALWLGANIIKSNNVPAFLEADGSPGEKINRILIYNHYQHIHHSLILISAC